MLNNLKLFIGYVLALPMTFFGVIYAAFFNLMGWYKWHGVLEKKALVWIVDLEKSPKWVLSLWDRWAGHAIGNVVVLKQNVSEENVTVKHELTHVDQCMILGIFQPIIYLLCYVATKASCKNSHPYYDNLFEIDARRSAGQLVDIYGALKQQENDKKNDN